MNRAVWAWPGGPLPLEDVAGASEEAAVRAQEFPHLHRLGSDKERRTGDYKRVERAALVTGPPLKTPCCPPLSLHWHHTQTNASFYVPGVCRSSIGRRVSRSWFASSHRGSYIPGEPSKGDSSSSGSHGSVRAHDRDGVIASHYLQRNNNDGSAEPLGPWMGS